MAPPPDLPFNTLNEDDEDQYGSSREQSQSNLNESQRNLLNSGEVKFDSVGDLAKTAAKEIIDENVINASKRIQTLRSVFINVDDQTMKKKVGEENHNQNVSFVGYQNVGITTRQNLIVKAAELRDSKMHTISRLNLISGDTNRIKVNNIHLNESDIEKFEEKAKSNEISEDQMRISPREVQQSA